MMKAKKKDSDSEDEQDTKKANAKEVNKEPANGSDDEGERDQAAQVKAAPPKAAAPPPAPTSTAGQPQTTEQEEYLEIAVARREDLNLTNMKEFISRPPPRGKMVQCTIMRDKSNMSKKFSPKYHVYLSVNDSKTEGTDLYLMTGKKLGVKATSSYYIGHEKNNFDKESPHLVAKLK